MKLSANAVKLLTNAISLRCDLIKSQILRDATIQNVNEQCGYPGILDIPTLKYLWERDGVAARVINIYPDECWKRPPVLFDVEDSDLTDFEEAWNTLNSEHLLMPMMHTLDQLTGIGTYGVLLLGVGDGRELKEPVANLSYNSVGKCVKKGNSPLLYVRVFDESAVSINEYETDTRNFRYGAPKIYSIDLSMNSGATRSNQQPPSSTIKVHWTRIVHSRPEKMSRSNYFGHPRLECVYDRIIDLRKIVAGSGEMFWKGGFPGISFETHPDLLENFEFDKTALKAEIEEYQKGLKRYMTLIGMSAKSLAPQVADPTGHFKVQIQYVSASIATPYRIFIGTEEAQMAGDQDSSAWNERLRGRQTNYVDTMIIKPVVKRLIEVGALPEPTNDTKRVNVFWPDLYTRTEKDKANIAKALTEAMVTYVEGGASSLIDPKQYLQLVCRFTEDETANILNSIGTSDLELLTAKEIMDMQKSKFDPSVKSKSTRPSRAKLK